MSETNTSAVPEGANAPSKPKKKHTGRRIFLLILLLLWLFNTFTLKTTREELTSPDVHNEITIAALSDYHAGLLGVQPEAILRNLKKIDPDLICILGDMYTEQDSGKSCDRAISLIKKIAAQHPDQVYFVPGEHDRTYAYMDTLREAGVHVLDYKQEQVQIGSTTLELYGIDNAYFSPTFDLTNAFELPDPDVYSILLAHIPMPEKYASFGADLVLCGDTHGGVVQLPFLGPVYEDGIWLPQVLGDGSTVYDKGLFTCGTGKLFVTSGIGNYPSIPIRFMNRPEIGVIKIIPE